MTDPSWLAAPAGSAPLPRDVWLPSTQVFLAREGRGTAAGLTLVAKGGTNDEHHNHNDVGSFIVAVDGIPAIVDAGRPTYTAATFGPDRYDIWTMQSAWHNVPVVDGRNQPAGDTARARDAAVDIAEDRATFRVELADAYPGSGVRSWTRRATLDRGAQRIEVADAWIFSDRRPTTADTLVHLLVAGEVEVGHGTARIRPLGGARPVRLAWSGGADVRSEVRMLDDPMLTEVWGDRLTRLSISCADRTELSIAVQLDTPTEDPA